MNKDQAGGILERWIYAAIFSLAMRAVAKGYIDADMADYIAAGGVALAGGLYGWWHNRPVGVLNRAGNAVPASAKLVIDVPPSAPTADVARTLELALKTNAKVLANTP